MDNFISQLFYRSEDLPVAEELRGRSRLSAEARNYVAYIPVPLNDDDEDEEVTDEDTGGSESYYEDEDEYYDDVSWKSAIKMGKTISEWHLVFRMMNITKRKSTMRTMITRTHLHPSGVGVARDNGPGGGAGADRLFGPGRLLLRKRPRGSPTLYLS